MSVQYAPDRSRIRAHELQTRSAFRFSVTVQALAAVTASVASLRVFAFGGDRTASRENIVEMQ